MTELEGQLDALALLGEPAPMAAFTVYEMTKELGWPNKCGWCGKSGFQGGGATRWPDDDQLSIAYNYCAPCVEKHRGPKLRELHASGVLRLVRYAEYAPTRKGAS